MSLGSLYGYSILGIFIGRLYTLLDTVYTANF